MTSRYTRRQVLRATAVASVGGPLLLPSCRKEARGGPPDILVVILDSLRAISLPMYGCPRSTAPFLEQLSTRSTLFEHCYASAPWTKPAVTGILTGRSCLEHRVTRPAAVLPEEIPTFSSALRKHGYRTGYFTANGMISEGYGAEKHFDRVSYEAVKGHSGETLVEEFGDWLDEDPDAPILAYLHFFQPHGPYVPPREFLEAILKQGRGADDFLRPEHHDVDVSITSLGIMGRIPHYQAVPVRSRDPLRYLAHYEANVLYADSQVEKLFDRYADLRGGRRVISAVTADHGESLGEHGFFCHHGIMLSDTILHVPLIVNDSHDPTPRAINTPVSHLDLGNTILHWAGVPGSIGGRGVIIDPNSSESVDGERSLVHQTIPAGDGMKEHGEIGFALTRGPWRLVYNDCPTCGNANHLEVLAGEASPAAVRRVPLHAPTTSIVLPVELAPGVVLERFAVHTPFVEAGVDPGYSGRLRIDGEESGVLTMRLRHGGAEPRELGVVEASSGTNPIEGELGVLEPEPGARDTESVVVEARWSPGGEAASSNPVWRRLTTFPLHVSQPASPFLRLIGVEVTPEVVRPGDLVRARFVWQCEKWLKESLEVSLRLVDARGEIVWQERRPFFGIFFEEDQKTLPRTIFHAGFRFLETEIVPLPADAAPGDLRFVVEVEDESPQEVTAGRVTIVEDRPTAFRAALARDLGLEHYRLGGSGAAPEDLERFQERFPDEGQPYFLRALALEEAGPREREIDRCLELVPYHRAALELAADRSGAEERRRLHKLLTPDHSVDFNFGELFRLFGYDLHRAPDGNSLYLSLYWEALLRTRRALTAELVYPIGDPSKKKPKELWWFPGTGIRPTNTWKIGEAIKETVHLSLPSDAERIELNLKVYSHWDFFYNGRQEKNCLPVREGDSDRGTEAPLGVLTLGEIPESPRDLRRIKRHDPLQYQLYDLIADPGEERNLVGERPELFEELKEPLVSLLELGDRGPSGAWSSGGVPEDVELSEDMLEQLRKLGYVK